MEKVYTAEFLVHEAACSAPHVAQPAVTFKFLQFPVLSVYGSSQGRLLFGRGKSCKFSMTPESFRFSMKNSPLTLMLVDSKNLKLLGAADVDLSLFSSKSVPEGTDFKRNLVKLYDPMGNASGRIDLSISFSVACEDPKAVFRPIEREHIVRIPVGNSADKAVATDPVHIDKPATTHQETFTDIVLDSPALSDNYQPPPMFFCNAKQRVKRPVQSVSTKEAPKKVPARAVPIENNLLIDQLLQELLTLRNSSVPTLSRENIPRPPPTIPLQTIRTVPINIIPPTHSDYSEDFEEEFSASIRCFVCGDSLKPSEASSHKHCTKQSPPEDYSQDFEEESCA